jgi:hypothetical protein
MDQRQPAARSRPHRRLKGALAAGAAFVLNGILYEVIPVFGSARFKARIKTAAAGGTLDLVFVGPDFDPAQVVAFASLAGTQYSTGNPTQVAVTAGTATEISTDCYGEGYLIVKFTGGGTGTISYCDTSQV